MAESIRPKAQDQCFRIQPQSTNKAPGRLEFLHTIQEKEKHAESPKGRLTKQKSVWPEGAEAGGMGEALASWAGQCYGCQGYGFHYRDGHCNEPVLLISGTSSSQKHIPKYFRV